MKGKEIGSPLNGGTARMKEEITLCVNGLEERFPQRLCVSAGEEI
jgi:hypothetical protein